MAIDHHDSVPVPTWLHRARSYLGRRELVGGGRLSAWVRSLFKSTRFPFALVNEKTLWCAAFACTVLEQDGIPSPRSARARDFLTWGIGLAYPVRGSLLVFGRGDNGGHVGFCEAPPVGRVVRCLGGNQSNQVSVANKSTVDLLGVRWPKGRPLPPDAVQLSSED